MVVSKVFLDVTWLDKPKLFISSTMDKNTVAHRKAIIEGLQKEGHETIDFRSPSFPYSNTIDESVIDETVNAVSKADIFILIVDENYGSLIDNKSVVHHEYKKAVELNLAIFVFVNKSVWDDYKRGIVSSDGNIKSQAHFDFINELSTYKMCFFETASDCLIHINQQLLNYLGGFLKFTRQAKWIWNESYTRSIEKNAREVWIITPDFWWDFDDPEFHRIVMTNVIERHCIYKYIYKESPDNTSITDEMMNMYKRELKGTPFESELFEQVQFLPVTPEKFYWSCEQVLYNPKGRDERFIIDASNRTVKFSLEQELSKRIHFRKLFVCYWNTYRNENCDEIVEKFDESP